MSPIARSAVRFTQRTKNTELRKKTLALIEEATEKPELAHFTRALLKYVFQIVLTSNTANRMITKTLPTQVTLILENM